MAESKSLNPLKIGHVFECKNVSSAVFRTVELKTVNAEDQKYLKILEHGIHLGSYN